MSPRPAPDDASIRIPFNRPGVVGEEMTYMRQAILGGHTSGDGPFTRRAQTLLEQKFGGQSLLTTSCTAALEIAAHLSGLGPGDEVIMPSFTFVSTANAVVLRGATPVFVDIRPDSFNLDERLIEAAITPRTRAIVPVHYAGMACEMDVIMDIARRHRLWVVEDAAQAVGARHRDRWLGTIGHIGCYSFHETKNLSCGEGGALVVGLPDLLEHAEILREKGTNRSQFRRGQTDKYTWTGLGSSYVPSDILAAMLVGQLECSDRITDRRRAIFDQYDRALAPLVERGLIGRQVVPPTCTPNHHMVPILAADPAERAALIDHMRRAGILTPFHYVPLHTSPFARALGLDPKPLPVTEDISRRLLRLPIHFDLADAEVAEVAEAVHDFYRHRPRHAH